MLKEKHLRVWKRLTFASKLGAGKQRARTSSPCVFPRRALSGSIVPSTERCHERLQSHIPQTYAQRVEFRSRILRSSITCPHNARLLFTSNSSNAVVNTTTKNISQTNLDSKTRAARKPPSTARRPTSQKVRYFFKMIM